MNDRSSDLSDVTWKATARPVTDDPVFRALWYVESNMSAAITLAEVSDHAHVSRFHLARRFAAVTGFTVMGYLRARRLTRAAELLTERPEMSVLEVALDVGYGSHEALTSAFTERFGVPPSSYRRYSRVSVDEMQNKLPGRWASPRLLGTDRAHQQAISLEDRALRDVPAPRMETLEEFVVAGVRGRYDRGATGGIPAQWTRFIQDAYRIPGRVGEASYGVCCPLYDPESFDYICGVEVAQPHLIPAEFAVRRIPTSRYAVFAHTGHISTIGDTVAMIWGHWLPERGCDYAATPDFERYLPDFDPHSGYGGIEIWVPAFIPRIPSV